MKIRINDEKKLKLTNSGDLSLYFLGTGSAFAKTLNQNNVIIIKGDEHLMVDFGTKAAQALFKVGLMSFEIQNFFITHSHADHIGGLEEAMMFGRYVIKKKPNLFINDEFKNTLWDMSLRGGSAFSEIKDGEELTIENFWKIHTPKKISALPRDTWEFNIGSINVKIFRTKHIPDNADSWENSFWSTGLIIDNRVLFSADTQFDSELLTGFNKKFNLETIFHDVQFFPGGVHAPLEELKELPKEIKKKTILMHYGDNYNDFQTKIDEYGFQSFAKENYFYDY